MKALITGKSKLAGAIISRLHDTIVYKKLEIESCRVEAEIPWKHFDIFINNASVGFSQTDLLNEAFSEWRHDSNKLIINIGLRAGRPNISKGYLYGAQKAALNHLADNLNYNSDRKCGIITLNLGLVEHVEIPSLTYDEVVDCIENLIVDWYSGRAVMTNLTLEHRENYIEVQQYKKELKEIEEDFQMFTDNST